MCQDVPNRTHLLSNRTCNWQTFAPIGHSAGHMVAAFEPILSFIGETHSVGIIYRGMRYWKWTDECQNQKFVFSSHCISQGCVAPKILCHFILHLEWPFMCGQKSDVWFHTICTESTDTGWGTSYKSPHHLYPFDEAG